MYTILIIVAHLEYVCTVILLLLYVYIRQDGGGDCLSLLVRAQVALGGWVVLNETNYPLF